VSGAVVGVGTDKLPRYEAPGIVLSTAHRVPIRQRTVAPRMMRDQGPGAHFGQHV